MNATSQLGSAWHSLLFCDGNVQDRLCRTLKVLASISPADLSCKQQALANQITLNKIRSFGDTEMANYVQTLSSAKRHDLTKTIAQMYLLDA